MELIDKFIKFEYEEDLFNKEIQGVKFWHHIRFSIYKDIFKQKYNSGQELSDLSGKKFITKVCDRIMLIPNLILKNPLYGLKQRNILVLNCARRIRDGRYYDDIYTDDILKNINRTYYVLEEPCLGKHFKPIRTENIRYFDYIYFIILVKIIFFKFINPKYGNLCEKDVNELYLLLNNINKIFNVNIDNDRAFKEIKKLILWYKLSKKYYEKILDKIKPKIIIEECSYAFSRFLINEIAKRKEIPTIELQHGVMGKYHIAYNFYSKKKLETFPDYIFLFGEYWKKNTRFPLESDRLIVTGFPYLEKKTMKVQQICKNDKKNIFLFISDTGKGLRQMAIKLDNLIDHKKYKIIYKLHPKEYYRWEKKYQCLRYSNIEVIDNNDKDIYYYLSMSTFQIGVSSTAIIEGLRFNLKTFIYKGFSYKYMEYLYKNNFAQLVSSAEEVMKHLNNNQKVLEDKNIFWKLNSLKNIINNVNNIYDRN